MATEYRICTKQDHPGYVFVESSPWGIPGLWMAIFAEMIGDRDLDSVVMAAEKRLADHLKASRKPIFTKYLGRLP